MSDTYEAFYNGKPLNPNRGLPTMSYAQAEDCGLTDSERLWCCTDGDGTVITADEVPYDSNNSVKDKIDGLITSVANKASIIHGTEWGGSKQITLDQSKFYFVCCATESVYSMCYIFKGQGWVISGTNNANITISGDVMTIPIYQRYMIISW